MNDDQADHFVAISGGQKQEYKDASSKAQECRVKVEGIRMTEVYNAAIKKRNQATRAPKAEQSKLYLEAIHLFESVILLYDSRQQVTECKAALAKLSEDDLTDGVKYK